MQQLVAKLILENKTISTMESCTGGGVANQITNTPGASAVLKFSAVTYSNEYKIKMGVSKEIIDTYSVYSMNTAMEMSKNISFFANADYGVGITGKMRKKDINNPYGDDSLIYLSIYDKEQDIFYNTTIEAIYETRKENKALVIATLKNLFLEKINNKEVVRKRVKDGNCICKF